MVEKTRERDVAERTDVELISLIRDGDPEPYNLLVARYQGHVYGLAYSLAGNWEDAQDIAQETFIRAYVNLDQLREPRRFPAWLRRITFSVAMKWLKAFRTGLFEQLNGRVDLDSLEIPDFAPGPQEVVERKELAEAVQRAIQSLPPKYRIPLTMFHLDGLSFQKVADFFDIPLGTAKSLIHRAREKLKVSLGTYYSEEVLPMVQEVFNEHKLPAEWTKEVYEKSISGRCWFYTPYDGGKWSDLVSGDEELRQIVAMESELGPLPSWARSIVEGCMYHVGACGHYLFPGTVLEVLDAIGQETPPPLAHGCFTVERAQKKTALDYCLCLDAWLAGASPEDAANELSALAFRKIDWQTVCADLWNVLGERDEIKELLVERLLHYIRYNVKYTVWDDDRGHEFCRDEYLGKFSQGEGGSDILAYYEMPTFDYDKQSPRVQRVEARLAEICPNWPRVRDNLLEWWLCAPKSFRFLERKLWSIGKGQSDGPFDSELLGTYESVPDFLKCEDTYPNHDEAAAWWREFMVALGGWWKGTPAKGVVADDVSQRLGESTSLKRWLVRLYARRLRRLEENNEQFSRLVNPKHTHKRGNKPLSLR